MIITLIFVVINFWLMVAGLNVSWWFILLALLADIVRNRWRGV